ncbi:hypothetical protein SDC9_165873 [bioreactor metagenome]|uniref:Uncharacterized protein n=1 Tax=bioreactor metagenome TaxID=1076179 RepID=A0A645G398_9ZZZZ
MTHGVERQRGGDVAVHRVLPGQRGEEGGERLVEAPVPRQRGRLRCHVSVDQQPDELRPAAERVVEGRQRHPRLGDDGAGGGSLEPHPGDHPFAGFQEQLPSPVDTQVRHFRTPRTSAPSRGIDACQHFVSYRPERSEGTFTVRCTRPGVRCPGRARRTPGPRTPPGAPPGRRPAADHGRTRARAPR